MEKLCKRLQFTFEQLVRKKYDFIFIKFLVVVFPIRRNNVKNKYQISCVSIEKSSIPPHK